MATSGLGQCILSYIVSVVVLPPGFKLCRPTFSVTLCCAHDTLHVMFITRQLHRVQTNFLNVLRENIPLFHGIYHFCMKGGLVFSRLDCLRNTLFRVGDFPRFSPLVSVFLVVGSFPSVLAFSTLGACRVV